MIAGVGAAAMQIAMGTAGYGVIRGINSWVRNSQLNADAIDPFWEIQISKRLTSVVYLVVMGRMAMRSPQSGSTEVNTHFLTKVRWGSPGALITNLVH
jgi:hypothetical protein